MDHSVISEYDNVSVREICSDSLLYQAMNNVVSITTVNGNRIFCPLCASTFEFKFSLLDHLKSKHFAFLCRPTDETLVFVECPLCYANFFDKHTVVKHVLRVHSNIIAGLYLKVGENEFSSKKCHFCDELFEKNHDTDFVDHTEKNHLLQFSEFFQKQFMQTGDSFKSPIKNLTVEKGYFDFSKINEQLSFIDAPNEIHKPRKLDSKTKMKSCRVLQFDLSVEDKENSMIGDSSKNQIMNLEQSILKNSCLKQVKWFDNTLERCPTREPLHCSTPKKSKLNHSKKKLKINKKPTFRSYFYEKDLNFECGKCHTLFEENTELDCHVKSHHRLFIFNLLHPCYQCAMCKAKFYKNYYLKKHIILHSNCKKPNLL